MKRTSAHLRARPGTRLAAAVASVAGLLALGANAPARAIDWDGRWWVAGRVADYLPADEQGGGFRLSQQLFQVRNEREVKVAEKFFPTISLGRGLKRWEGEKAWKQVQLSLELELSSFDAPVGDETGFRDDNASTRIALPSSQPSQGVIRPDGDERFESLKVGELRMSPVFVNTLWHWGSERADFYAGAGVGVIFASVDESKAYREFVGDLDGVDDVTADDAFAVNFKIGSNFRLFRGSNWYGYFEAQFFTTELFGSSAQLEWKGTVTENGNGVFLGQRDYDYDLDGELDTFGVDSDFHVVDPGKIRLDGAAAGFGVRYRFGGGRRSAATDSGS